MFPRFSCFACSRWRVLHDRWQCPSALTKYQLGKRFSHSGGKMLFWTRWIGEIALISRSGTWCARKSMVEFRDVSPRVLWSSLRPDEKGSSHSVREGDADGPRIGRASSNVNQLRGVIAVVQASTNRPLPAPGWLCRCLCLWKTPARVMKLDISRAGPTKWMKPGRLDVDGEMHSRHGKPYIAVPRSYP